MKPHDNSLYSIDSKGKAFVQHISHDKSGKSRPESMPSVNVTISVSESSYYQTKLLRPAKYKPISVSATPDTAAQITLAGTNPMQRMNIAI